MQYACIVTTRVDWLPIAMLPPLVRIGYDDVRRKTRNNTVMVGGPSVLCYTMYVTTTILLLPRALHLQQSLCCGLRRPRESWGAAKGRARWAFTRCAHLLLFTSWLRRVEEHSNIVWLLTQHVTLPYTDDGLEHWILIIASSSIMTKLESQVVKEPDSALHPVSSSVEGSNCKVIFDGGTVKEDLTIAQQ